MYDKHNPAKQLKKAGTVGQESTVFILQEENEQVEPNNTLLLNQEAVKRKNQPSERTQYLVVGYHLNNRIAESFQYLNPYTCDASQWSSK